MGHVLAKTILTSQTIELIAKKYKVSIDEARKRFYESVVCDLLDDDETGLYGESALYLLSLYESSESKNYKGEVTPKYKVGDIVTFDYLGSLIKGVVQVVDTFPNSTAIHYDILDEEEPRLYKHLLESQIISKF